MAPDQHTTLRWFLDITTLIPSPKHVSFLLSLLPENEQLEASVFVQDKDKLRALCSRLMQRTCTSRVLGIDPQNVIIKRTKGRKPYATNPKPSWAPNFNFNVSHEGDYVALAAEPVCICGVDVAAPHQHRRIPGRSFSDTMPLFRQQLSVSEWQLLTGFPCGDPGQEACFQRLWSLKEAFIKARGDGLGFEPLSRASFTFSEGDLWSSTATLCLDGQHQDRWVFQLDVLPGGYWVAVARGPPEHIVDAHGEFKGSLMLPEIETSAMRRHLQVKAPPFELLTIEDLLPREHVAAYLQLA